MHSIRKTIPILTVLLAGLASCAIWLTPSAASLPTADLPALSRTSPQQPAQPLLQPIFASPDGSGTDCTQIQPCDLGTATTLSAPGGTLYLAGGVYTATGSAVLVVSHSLGISVAAGASINLMGNLWGTGTWANQTDYAGSGLIVDVAGNLHGDPGFIDAEAGDFRLRPDSEARNHGLPTDTHFDLPGRQRPNEYYWDIGAYEYYGEGLFLPLVVR